MNTWVEGEDVRYKVWGVRPSGSGLCLMPYTPYHITGSSQLGDYRFHFSGATFTFGEPYIAGIPGLLYFITLDTFWRIRLFKY